MKINRIIGKNSLVLVAQGQKQLAAQIFNYDQIREIRMDFDDLEVKVLLFCDDSYHRVFKIELSDQMDFEEAKKLTFNFHNNFLNASMKLSKEEIDNLKKQKEEMAKKMNETSKKSTENITIKKEVPKKATSKKSTAKKTNTKKNKK